MILQTLSYICVFLQGLQEDIDNHRDHHEAVNNTADQLLSRTDVDHPFIKEQVGEANRRWDELQKGETGTANLSNKNYTYYSC